jgi:hypothetical protein
MIKIDETLANFIKEIYTQQRGNIRNKEKGPKLEQKNQAPKWVTMEYRINHVPKPPLVIRNILEKNEIKSFKNK